MVLPPSRVDTGLTTSGREAGQRRGARTLDPSMLRHERPRADLPPAPLRQPPVPPPPPPPPARPAAPAPAPSPPRGLHVPVSDPAWAARERPRARPPAARGRMSVMLLDL